MYSQTGAVSANELENRKVLSRLWVAECHCVFYTPDSYWFWCWINV